MTCSIDVHFGFLSSAAQVDLVTPNVKGNRRAALTSAK